MCKEQLSKEVSLKNEALSQRECIQAMLQTKSSDLVKSNLECSKLQEKNLALVKEIAALKLVSDCNLEEDEIVKLATVGHESNSQDAIDVLKKSLVIRNKSYKELMAKCSSLGRGEARSERKLEKAKEKIVKLKTRVQELEVAIEEKENEVLRSLKASKKRNCAEVNMPGINKHTSPCPSSELKFPPVVKKDQSPTSVIDLDEDGIDDPVVVKENNNDASVKCKGDDRTLQHMEKKHYDVLIQNKIQQSKHQFGESGLAGLRNEALFDHSASKETSGLGLQDIRQVQPSFKSAAETSSSVPVAEPGNLCFTGGLLGPDGGNRYLGKWCKRTQDKPMLGSTSDADSLITKGADGRGGTVKVLRSLNQINMDARDSFASAKRFKPGTKSSGLQSQGCLQIDHFFRKANS